MRKRVPINKDGMGIKVAIFCGSLLVCLTAAEIGLRLTGFALTTSRQREFIPPFDERIYHVDETFERYLPDSKHDRLILTMGDSLTNGGNVKSYNSYPYYLYKNFTDAGKRASVYNMGYCEDSTFGVAMKYKNFLRAHAGKEMPDAVVILVGAADLFNIPLIRERKLKDDTFWHDVLPVGWLYTLRLYKVFRHIRLNWAFRHAKDAGKDKATTEEKFALLMDVYKAHKRTMGDDQKKDLAPELVAKVEAAFPDDIRQADLDVAIVGDFADLLTDYGGRVFTTQGRYDEYFAFQLEVALTFPEGFWNDYFTSANYHLVQSYQAQSKLTAAEVLKALDASEAKNPDLRHNENFRHFRKILRDREEMDTFVDGKRMETWDEIVALSRERNIQLVLQNYPVAYKSANRVISQVAQKYGLPLIDNNKFFGELIAKEGREKYLEDDDHLKPVGNELLARNVYETLLKGESVVK